MKVQEVRHAFEKLDMEIREGLRCFARKDSCPQSDGSSSSTRFGKLRKSARLEAPDTSRQSNIKAPGAPAQQASWSRAAWMAKLVSTHSLAAGSCWA